MSICLLFGCIFCLHSKEIGKGNHFVSQVLAHSDTTSMHTEYVNWSGKEIHISDIGFSLIIPQQAVPYRDLVKISICALVNGAFVLPTELDLVSPIYFMTATPDIVFK